MSEGGHYCPGPDTLEAGEKEGENTGTHRSCPQKPSSGGQIMADNVQ